MNRQEELLTGGGSGVGDGGAEGLSAIEDGGQAAISLTPDFASMGSGFLLNSNLSTLQTNDPVASGCYAVLSRSVVSNSLLPPGTIACQAALSMRLSRQEYWSGLSCPLSGYLPNPGIELRSLTLQADSLLSEPPGKPWVTALFFSSIDDTLHSEWLLQPLCTILHFGPMPQKLTTPL